MSKYTYDKILTAAKTCTTNVSKEYKLGVTTKWGYYFAKSILSPKKDITKISFNTASNPVGTKISRQVKKTEYTDMAKRLVNYVEKHKQLPNYITLGSHQVRTRLYVLMFAKILVSYSKNNKFPDEVNVNYKAFTKPVETGNAVYDYFVKKTGKKFTTIDDVLAYVKKYGSYSFYFDDHQSNKEVTDTMSANCTDWLQWLINMAKAMGYEWKAIHVKCRVSGTGHVRGQFRHPKNTNGNWINRDPAAVADGGSITSIWCENGYKLGENPSWFLANLNR